MTVGFTTIRDVLYPVREARQYYAAQLADVLTPEGGSASSLNPAPPIDEEQDAEHDDEGNGDEEPGEWLTIGSAVAMPTGAVKDLIPFLATMAGRSPDNRFKVLGAGRPGHVPGVDLTFSLPKSLSIYLAALEQTGKAHIAMQIRADVHAAIREALEIAYNTGTFMARRGSAARHTLRLERVDGIPATLWHHRTARANDSPDSRRADPQEHCHIYIPNLARRRDGTWGAIDRRRIPDDKMMIGSLFRAALAARLSARDLRLRATGKGQFDLALPIRWIQLFSCRRAEIQRLVQETTGEQRTDTNLAALATRMAVSSRGPKELLPPLTELKAEWTQRLMGHGVRWADIVHRAEASHKRSTPTISDLNDDKLISAACTSIMTRRQVRTAVAGLACGDGSLGAFDAMRRADDIIKRLIPLGRQREAEFFCSAELLARERRVLQWSHSRQEEAPRLAFSDATQAIGRANRKLDDRYGNGARLSARQETDVTRLLTGAGGIKVLRGGTATGKSTVLAAVAEAFRTARHLVGFFLPSLKAAKRTNQESGETASDIGRFVEALKTGKTVLGNQHVLIVDDAHQIPLEPMELLLEHAHAAGANVIVTGDDRTVDGTYQHGLAFRAMLAVDPEFRPPLPNQDISPDIRLPSLELAAGRPVQALLGLAGAGRVDLVANANDALMKAANLVADWIIDDMANGKLPAAAFHDNLVICATNAEARAVAEAVRKNLPFADMYPSEEVVIAVAGGEFGPSSHRMSIRKGDRVVIHEAHGDLGLVSGDALTIEDVDQDYTGAPIITATQEPYGRKVIINGDGLVVKGERRGRRRVRLQHAVARTATGARDLMVDRVVIVATKPLDRQRVLASLAHHRVDCRILVVPQGSAPKDKERFVQAWADESGLAFRPRCVASLLDQEELVTWIRKGLFKGIAVGGPVTVKHPDLSNAKSIQQSSATSALVTQPATALNGDSMFAKLHAKITEIGQAVRKIRENQTRRDERFAALVAEFNATKERRQAAKDQPQPRAVLMLERMLTAATPAAKPPERDDDPTPD